MAPKSRSKHLFDTKNAILDPCENETFDTENDMYSRRSSSGIFLLGQRLTRTSAGSLFLKVGIGTAREWKPVMTTPVAYLSWWPLCMCGESGDILQGWHNTSASGNCGTSWTGGIESAGAGNAVKLGSQSRQQSKMVTGQWMNHKFQQHRGSILPLWITRMESS